MKLSILTTLFLSAITGVAATLEAGSGAIHLTRMSPADNLKQKRAPMHFDDPNEALDPEYDIVQRSPDVGAAGSTALSDNPARDLIARAHRACPGREKYYPCQGGTCCARKYNRCCVGQKWCINHFHARCCKYQRTYVRCLASKREREASCAWRRLTCLGAFMLATSPVTAVLASAYVLSPCFGFLGIMLLMRLLNSAILDTSAVSAARVNTSAAVVAAAGSARPIRHLYLMRRNECRFWSGWRRERLSLECDGC